MIDVQLDVSWRRAEPITVWLLTPPNAMQPTKLVDVEALGKDGRRGPSTPPCVRFGVNTAGRIWLASAFRAMHGDESRGRIAPGSYLGDEVKDAYPLIWGAITFEPTYLRIHADTRFLDPGRRHLAFEGETRARILLEGLPTWQALVHQAADVKYRSTP